MYCPYGMKHLWPANGGSDHWVLDLEQCACDRVSLESLPRLRQICLQACQASGMKVVGDCFHQFEPVGVTGTVLLAESHLAIHTWPELAYVALDVYVCDYSSDNTAKGLALVASLRQSLMAGAVRQQHLSRCSVHHQPAGFAEAISRFVAPPAGRRVHQ